MYVYALFLEDPWDEYYEDKLHAIFSSLEKAKAHLSFIKRYNGYHIEKIPLDHVPETKDNTWQSYLLYEIVERG